MYTPRNQPAQYDAAFENQEKQNIRKAMQDPVDAMVFKTLYAEPSRLYEGMDVLADGAVWDPGAGAGRYCYYAGSWKKLG